MFNEMFSFKKNTQTELPVDMIYANPDQPRKVFDDRELEELRDSIREFGIIQPLVVKREREGKFLLIAGERRLRASIMAGLDRVPVTIREADDKDTALIALVENVQRENLSYIEEAAAYKSLMDDYGLTQSEISRRVGKQQSTISNKIRLLVLPVEIQTILAKHQLSERHARALLKVEDNQVRFQLLDKIIAHNLNVKQSEKLIDDFLAKKEEERRKNDKLKFINYRIYVNTIKKAFFSISEVEKNAKFYQEDKGDHLEMRIIIPKNAVREKRA